MNVAESISTGMWRVASWDLILRQASKPLSPGILTSSTAMSGSSVIARATAASPSETSITSKPERRSIVATT